MLNSIIELRRKVDHQVPIPDVRNPKLRIAADVDADVTVWTGELDGLSPAFLNGQEWVFHHIPIVPQRRVKGCDLEQVGLYRRFHTVNSKMSAKPRQP